MSNTSQELSVSELFIFDEIQQEMMIPVVNDQEWALLRSSALSASGTANPFDNVSLLVEDGEIIFRGAEILPTDKIIMLRYGSRARWNRANKPDGIPRPVKRSYWRQPKESARISKEDFPQYFYNDNGSLMAVLGNGEEATFNEQNICALFIVPNKNNTYFKAIKTRNSVALKGDMSATRQLFAFQIQRENVKSRLLKFYVYYQHNNGSEAPGRYLSMKPI